jgi:uncharacterized membrane protein
MKELLIFAVLIVLMDIPFITKFVGPNYHSLGMALKPKIFYALCAYLIMISSWFIIQGDVIKGAFTGFSMYGVYAFTLLSILPGYTLSFGLMEIIWGTLLFTLATIGTNKIKRIFM